MKQIFVLTTCVLAFATAGAVIFSVHSANQNANLRNQWQTESKASKAKLAELADAVESGKESIATLENKVSKLSGDLNKNEGELSAANEKIQAYALAEQNRVADERKKYLESVPQPTFDGKIYFFPKVVGAHGETLATNAAFAYITGRRLVFRPENETAIAVDVDNVHPLVLQYLGIDGKAVKERQRQIKEQAAADAAAQAEANRVQTERNRQAWEAGAPAREAKRIADAQLAIEQQKADAAQRTANAAQQQAQADKKKADAAWLDAQKPPPQINVIQQSQQIQTVQPLPRGYIQNNGVMVPYY